MLSASFCRACDSADVLRDECQERTAHSPLTARCSVRTRRLAVPLVACLAAGVTRAADDMAVPGRQLPAPLLDESQDAVAALYILLQVSERVFYWFTQLWLLIIRGGTNGLLL